jgi:hypothetical protein
MIKLHLGSGEQYMEGYINIDFPPEEHNVNHNVKVDRYDNILTMQYEKCDEIRSHHVFEHFNFFNSFVLLYKWTLALNKGGTLIIDVPDVEELCKAYLAADTNKKFLVMRYLAGSAEGTWAFHINGWSKDTLSLVLDKLGYKIVNINKYGSFNEAQPNCGICFTSVKEKELPKEELILNICELLSLYKNGNTDFENSLHEFYCQEFKKAI